jgi:hypothetical protein
MFASATVPAAENAAPAGAVEAPPAGEPGSYTIVNVNVTMAAPGTGTAFAVPQPAGAVGFEIESGVDISNPDADSDEDGLTNRFETRSDPIPLPRTPTATG